jgi:hypothetical protein
MYSLSGSLLGDICRCGDKGVIADLDFEGAGGSAFPGYEGDRGDLVSFLDDEEPFRDMREIGVTLSRFLMMRSAAIVPGVLSCFSEAKEVNQATIGCIAAAFLASVAHGVNTVRAAHL